MSSHCLLISAIIGILVVYPTFADLSTINDLETTTQVNDDNLNLKLSVNAEVSNLNLTSESRALYDQVKLLLTTDNMTDEAKFNQFKIILAKSTAVLFDKLAIEPPTGTVSNDDQLRQKRAAKKQGKFWIKILIKVGW
uniref:Secreted protein n=1 Tax=Panagrellus redivivus TaxID=6233 RepID=A0A7E4V0N6_PANRE